MPQSLSPDYWDQVADSLDGRYYFDSRTGRYKSDCFVSVVGKWLGQLQGGVLLKTDAWEEAFGSDQVLFRHEFRSTFNIGMDISPEVTRKAQERSGKAANVRFAACDLTSLPFKDRSIDMIVSTSTLDHFAEAQPFAQSINELSRILKPGGSLILILDNKRYIFRWLMKLKSRTRITQTFIGKTYTATELRGLLPEARLTILHVATIVHVPVLVFTKLFRLVSAVFGDKTLEVLNLFDKIGRFPLRFLTGTYIALHAVKK